MVLGMTSPSVFRQVFSEAGNVSMERLDGWFDQSTATFGGRDVVETVNEIVGNAARFDYQQVSSQLPRLDLPDLSPFVRSMLALNHRRVHQDESGMSFQTPDEWKKTPGVRGSYEGLIFDRSDRSNNAAQRILGVGHKVIDGAIQQAKTCEASVTVLAGSIIRRPIMTFRVVDQVTTESGVVRTVTVGVEWSPEKGIEPILLRDEDLLVKCNELTRGAVTRLIQEPDRPADAENVEVFISQAQQFLENRLNELDLPFKVPSVSPLAVIWPENGT